MAEQRTVWVSRIAKREAEGDAPSVILSALLKKRMFTQPRRPASLLPTPD
jgi:hypothetical protein